jgi:hypothetical protein
MQVRACPGNSFGQPTRMRFALQNAWPGYQEQLTPANRHRPHIECKGRDHHVIYSIRKFIL